MKTICSNCGSLREERSRPRPVPGQAPAAPPRPPRPAGHDSQAFSLIEIMVAVGLLTFIVLGLLAMFNQTQRAFRTSITQSDLLENARSAMDILTRDIEPMAACHVPAHGLVQSTNFFVEPSPGFPPSAQFPVLWRQDLPGTTEVRTNIVQQFFFLSRLNQDWIGTGYLVLPDDQNNPMVGTLYRFCATNLMRSGVVNVSSNFLNPLPWQLHRIADGVVHLRVVPYAPNGFPIVSLNLTRPAWYLREPGTNVFNRVPQAITTPNPQFPESWEACYFVDQAVPAYVEIELGMLEPQILQRYRSIPPGPAARQFLNDHAAQVHIFRQRIPIRNVDITAYP